MITELLGIKYPLFQGAMAQISRHELVIAVSNAGGLGVLASGSMDASTLRAEIKACKAGTDQPFAVNLMLMMPNIAELVEVVIEERVPIVTTGAGTPKAFIPKLQAAGIKIFPVIATVAQALKMAQLGVDGVVAEGTEAGGHVGETATFPLVRQVAQAVTIPVIAAGGIADGHGIVASFALGASGVQIGTRFLASVEVPIPESYKQAVVTARDTDTVVTGRSNRAPVRVISNAMAEKYLQMEHDQMPRERLEELTMGSLRKAVFEGDAKNGSLMAGQIAGIIQEVQPVAIIIEEMFKEADEVRAKLPLSFLPK